MLFELPRIVTRACDRNPPKMADFGLRENIQLLYGFGGLNA